MSSDSFTADVMLSRVEYQNLDSGPKNVNDWFQAWKRAKRRKSFKELLNLTHWGLQLPLHRERDGASVVQLFCHYLALADGHQSAKNFGYHGPRSTETDLSQMSHGERMQKLADKAWMELCNRVFVFSNDELGCERLKYAWYFRQPDLTTAFIRFIDPDRWCDGKLYHLGQANIDKLNRCAYHAKAHAFACRFLQEAWLYREILEREHAFRDLEEEDKAEMERRVLFFHRLKPRLARLMVYYEMEDFLHDKKLDHPTRTVLRNIAFGNTPLRTPVPDCEKADLAKAYGELHPKHGYPVMSHREAARILLLYPLVVEGRKQYIRQQVRRKLAAKAAEAERLQAELKTVADKLRLVIDIDKLTALT